MSPLFWLVAVGVVTGILGFLPPYMALLSEGGLNRSNYRDEDIPVAVGLLPAFIAALGAVALGIAEQQILSVGLAAGMFGAGTIGLLDDTVGNRNATGLRGHLQCLRSGQLSTGALKALLIPMLSLFLAFDVQRSLIWVIVDGAAIAMTANAINLLDVRPGRAVKASLFLLLLVLPAASIDPQMAALWGIITLAIVAYAPMDLQAKAMLGDCGANAFGLAIGWLLIRSWGPWGRIALVIVLTGLHAISERTSLSDLIHKNRLLRAVDRWGRQGE